MNRRYFRINEDAPLFNKLSQRPLWWEMLLDDKELYVNIRKDNRVNVYYRGASIMSLSFKDNKIDAEIHNYYLGAYKDGTDYYGNKHCSPEEIVRQLSAIKIKVDSNKKYIACFPGQEKNGKNYSSEKYVQSQLFLADSHYIDTEFALQLDDRTVIRIDLVKLTDDGEIAFQELKLIDDLRLKPSGENPAEILTQMANYDRFLKEANLLKGDDGEAIIVEYYKKVLNVMSAIGVKHIAAVPTSVRGYVDLFIKQIYTRKTIKRNHLVQSVLNVCKDLHSNVEDVSKEYGQLI
jgi:hypothetical protein